MLTTITTAHEEKYTDGTRTLGVLMNTDHKIDSDNNGNNVPFKDSFVYIYKEGMYIFFNTMIDMIDYLLYGEVKMMRAYMSEKDFDELYDKPFEGNFKNRLEWTTN